MFVDAPKGSPAVWTMATGNSAFPGFPLRQIKKGIAMPPSIATRRSLHPLNVIAAVAVILFCTAGMAGIMGWLPNSTGTTVQALDNPRLAISEQLIARQANPPAPASGWCSHCGNIESTRGLNTGSIEVRVRLDDGTLRTYHLAQPQWRTGERVNIINGTLVAAR
jgi:hypothetical protein